MKNRLTKERKKRKMKQAEVALLLGMSAGAYSHIERGIRKGSIDTWERLSAIFDIPIPELRKNPEKKKKQ